MRARLIAGVLAVLIGGVWIGQGLGYIPGSFMTGDPLWAVLGALLVAAGAVVIVLSRRRSATH